MEVYLESVVYWRTEKVFCNCHLEGFEILRIVQLVIYSRKILCIEDENVLQNANLERQIKIYE